MLEKLSQITAEQWLMIAGVVAMFFAFSCWSILDCWKRTYKVVNEKVAWIQIIIFIPILGTLAYVLIGRKRGESQQ